MKRMVLVLGAIALCCTKSIAAPSSSQLIARYHFSGTTSLLANTNAATLKKMWALPETTALRKEALDKIAAGPAQLLAKVLDTHATATNWIRPLLDDVVVNESAMEFRENGNHQLSFSVAVQIDDARAALWSGNLSNIVAAWAHPQPGEITKQGTTGWEFKNTVGYGRIGKWAFFSAGPDRSALELGQQLAAQSKLKPFADTNWFEGELDWPHLAAMYPIFSSFKFSHVTFSMSSKDGNVHTKANISLPQRVNFKPEPWHVPAIVTSPLISFTVAQPLDAFLQTDLVRQIGYNPWTNQIYFWAQSHLPLQTFGAVHVPNATNVLRAVASTTPAALNPLLNEYGAGQLVNATNGPGFLWKGLKQLSPYVIGHRDASGDFIIGGLFSRAPGKMPVPQELLKQIQSRDNLVYYDWEITENRIGHWQMLTQVIPILNKELPNPSGKQPRLIRDFKLPAQQWLRAVAPLFGNTATEVTISNPTQLAVKRKSGGGLTGMEFVLLSEQIDAPGFPFFGYQLSR